MAESLALSADEQDRLHEIIARFPAQFAAVEHQVELQIEDAVRRLQGFVLSESGVDYVLGRIVDRIVAEAAAQHRDGNLKDDCSGAMTLLIARNAAAVVRAGVMERLVGVKRN